MQKRQCLFPYLASTGKIKGNLQKYFSHFSLALWEKIKANQCISNAWLVKQVEKKTQIFQHVVMPFPIRSSTPTVTWHVWAGKEQRFFSNCAKFQNTPKHPRFASFECLQPRTITDLKSDTWFGACTEWKTTIYTYEGANLDNHQYFLAPYQYKHCSGDKHVIVFAVF